MIKIKKILPEIGIGFMFVLLHYFGLLESGFIDITNRWTSHTCSVHKEKLVQGRVDFVVGCWSETQPQNSNNYENPPYSQGEFPNAKFNFIVKRLVCKSMKKQ